MGFERLLPGPIERVWEDLTRSEKRGTWLATGPMELRVGGQVELFFRHADLLPHKEEVPERYKQMENGVQTFGRITRCDPPRLLAYTWGDSKEASGPGAESEVTFELTPRGEEVLLTLTHRRLQGKGEMVTSPPAGTRTSASSSSVCTAGNPGRSGPWSRASKPNTRRE